MPRPKTPAPTEWIYVSDDGKRIVVPIPSHIAEALRTKDGLRKLKRSYYEYWANDPDCIADAARGDKFAQGLRARFRSIQFGCNTPHKSYDDGSLLIAMNKFRLSHPKAKLQEFRKSSAATSLRPLLAQYKYKTLHRMWDDSRTGKRL